MLILKKEAMEKICSHAHAEYPGECCGIMLGRRLGEQRIVLKTVQTRNMAVESRRTTQFLINPMEIVKAELEAEREGFEIVGFYHSHPDYEAVTSKEDELHMIKGYSYLIISVNNGICVSERSFEKFVQTDAAEKEEIMVKEK